MAAVNGTMLSPEALDVASKLGWYLVDGFRYMFYIVHPKELALTAEDTAPKYLLLYGVPMFFLFILLEWLALKVIGTYQGGYKEGAANKAIKTAASNNGNGGPVQVPYRINDMIICATLGAAQYSGLLLIELMGLSIHVRAYSFVWERFRLYDIDCSFIVLMLGKDLGYYWMHRALHEFHLAWSAHSVHHSGEDYNLATGLRQGLLQPMFGWPFYLPLAFLGFPPSAFSAHAQLNTMYMYWIHTDVVNRVPLGLEYILNTPMAHRLHHRPPGNRNYAGMFIIWDRIFGTYEAELVRKDLYGLAKQPNTFDPVKLNTNHFRTMADIGRGKRQRSWLYRLVARRVPARWSMNLSNLWEPIPELQKDVRSSGPVRRKWDGERPAGPFTKLYMVAMAAIAFVSGVIVLLRQQHMERLPAIAVSAMVLALFHYIGVLADQKQGERAFAMAACAGIAPMLGYVVAAYAL